MVDFATVLSNTVVFLFDEDSQGPIGTAFVVGYPVPEKPDAFVPLVVTAKHVVGDRKEVVGRFSTISGTETADICYDLTYMLEEGDVWEHPDAGVDLIVFRTPHIKKFAYQPFPVDLIASGKKYKEEEIKATDRIMFPCLLVNFMGMTRNYPVVRDGSIALIPDELVPLEYKVGTRTIRTEQQVVLIDATSIPGASGAPIFLWPGPRLKSGAFTVGGTRPWLLGIMHGFYPSAPRELISVEISSVAPAFAENSGIAIVFPSWRLLEILNSEKLVKRIDDIAKTS